IAESFRLFSCFPWRGTVRFFGETYPANALPWFYPLAWIPLSWEPGGLVLLVAGLLAFVVYAVREAPGWRLSVKTLTGSLPLWSLLFAAAPWAALLALRPVLYDEERHFMFAMPMLAVCAALGLRRLQEAAKLALAGAVALSALVAAGSWGKYAY